MGNLTACICTGLDKVPAYNWDSKTNKIPLSTGADYCSELSSGLVAGA